MNLSHLSTGDFKKFMNKRGWRKRNLLVFEKCLGYTLQ